MFFLLTKFSLKIVTFLLSYLKFAEEIEALSLLKII